MSHILKNKLTRKLANSLSKALLEYFVDSNFIYLTNIGKKTTNVSIFCIICLVHTQKHNTETFLSHKHGIIF